MRLRRVDLHQKILSKMRIWVLLLWLGNINCGVLGSLGDSLEEFQECKEICSGHLNCASVSSHCELNDAKYGINSFKDVSLLYKFLMWDRNTECDYQCQHIITEWRIRDNQEVYQFHGKWPFQRFLGAQEFFSVIFSIGNIVPHLRGFYLLREELSSTPMSRSTRKLLFQYIYVSLVGMIAWIFSAIYHTRDLFLTEKLDYFFAGATVLTAFNAIFVRVHRLDRHRNFHYLFSTCVCFVFTLHILRLYLDWSYTYNMRFNFFFGVLQYFLLIVVALQNRRSLSVAENKPSYKYIKNSNLRIDLIWVPILLVCYTLIAISCELFDFFSYTLQIDAHAIWHGLVIIPTFYLYDFFIKDFRYLNLQDKELYSE